MPIQFNYMGLKDERFNVVKETRLGTATFAISDKPYIRTTDTNLKLYGEQEYIIPIAKLTLVNGLQFVVPKYKDSIWQPPDPENTRIKKVESSLENIKLSYNPQIRLDRFSWKDTRVGIMAKSKYTYKTNGIEVRVQTTSPAEDPNSNYVTFEWESNEKYGKTQTRLGATFGSFQFPLTYQITSPEDKHTIDIALSQERQRLDPAGLNKVSVVITDLDTREESLGIEALQKLNIPELPMHLPLEVTAEELSELVSNVVKDLTTGNQMGSALDYLSNIRES